MKTGYKDKDWPKPPYSESDARSLVVRRKLDRVTFWLRIIAAGVFLNAAVALF